MPSHRLAGELRNPAELLTGGAAGGLGCSPCAGVCGKYGAIMDRNGFILAGLLVTVSRSGARLKGSTFPGAALLRFPTGQEGNLFT